MDKASTQYTDLRGTVALDWHDPTQARLLAQSIGVDTERYFPVGFEFYGEGDLTATRVHCVDTKKAGETFEEIQRYLAKNPGDTVPFDGDGPDIHRFVKRIHVAVASRDLSDLV